MLGRRPPPPEPMPSPTADTTYEVIGELRSLADRLEDLVERAEEVWGGKSESA